ncbi:MAG: acyl-CoA/acyl-ACP dehydrogenase [Streptosporangiaceae bacterium]|nr:acyl-CoA/acyl-ACP dehydrogenase [Streptosporangiaceae bacterium]
MNFEQTDEQNDFAGLVRNMISGHGHTEGSDRFDTELWHELGKAGVLSAALPESLGGAGLGFGEQCAALVEFGRALAPVPYLPSIVLGAGAIARFGTPEQIARWAEPAARGELVLTAALEDDAAVSGAKTTVDAAPWADAFLVPAATGEGVRVSVVERSDPGVTVEAQELTDGVTAGRVVLDGVRPGADRMLGGPEVAEWLTAHGTVGLCALQLGVIERALELTAEYARNRVQFARPIGSFQAVAQRLADAWIDVAGVRLTMWQAAWRLAGHFPATADIATAKFWAADAGHRVAHTAVHIHGGMGIDTSYHLHRYFAAAKHYEFALGGATEQLRRIGAELAKALHHTKIA